MEIEEDPDYISYLRCLRAPGNSYNDFLNQEINHTCEIEPKRKRIRHDLSATKVIIKGPGSKRYRLEPDSVESRKKRKRNKEGLSRRKLVFRSSDGRTYDSEYFYYFSHTKEIGGEVIVSDQESDSVDELKGENNRFEQERENLVGEDDSVEEIVEKKRDLEVKTKEKTVEKDVIGEKVVTNSSSSFENLEIQSENNNAVAQVVGGTEEVPIETEKRMGIRKEKNGDIARHKANQSEEMEIEIETCQASPQPEPVNPHLQGFMLLMQKLCPVETTIYPGWNSNEGVIAPISEPSKTKRNEEKPKREEKRKASSSCPRGFFHFDWIEERREEEIPEEEMKSRRNGNNRCRTEIEALAAFPELSDSDEDPKMDEIPVEVLSRPPSDYKIGVEVIVSDQESDSVDELKGENNRFEQERENLVGEDDSVEEIVEKKRDLEVKTKEKTVEKDVIGEKVITKSSSSFENLEVQSENNNVVAQVVGGTEEVPIETENRMGIRKEKNGDIARHKANQSEEMEIEIETCQASPQPEPVNPHLQGFMLLMQKLCPVETTIFPGWNSNEGVIAPISEPSKSKRNEEKPNKEERRNANSSCPRGFFDFDWIEERREEEIPGEEIPEVEMRSRRNGNNRCRTEIEALAAFPELSDSDEDPKMDEIPVEVLNRPPSEYRNMLIRELKRPFDKCEYIELMKMATLRKKKTVSKDLRFGERTVETEEDSKSYFDYYSDVERKVKRARNGRRLTLLRGFFFWLLKSCWEESFKPWRKWRKGSKSHLSNGSKKRSKKLQNNT